LLKASKQNTQNQGERKPKRRVKCIGDLADIYACNKGDNLRIQSFNVHKK